MRIWSDRVEFLNFFEKKGGFLRIKGDFSSRRACLRRIFPLEKFKTFSNLSLFLSFAAVYEIRVPLLLLALGRSPGLVHGLQVEESGTTCCSSPRAAGAVWHAWATG